MKEKFVYETEFLLPKNNFEAWSVIACDQFTSEPEYWQEVEALVDGKYSTLNLILPEVYLKKDNTEKVKVICENMNNYLNNNVFKTTEKGFILIERSTLYKEKRIGLIATIDLEKYEYSNKSSALIRSTEGTIEERIPPRLKIRQDAPIELTHIMLLYDDETRSINEKLYAERDNFEKLYDFELNMNGGHIRGWFINDFDSVNNAFSSLIMPDKMMVKYGEKDKFLFAVGDGNHSLATAKAHWNNVKKNLTKEEQAVHPARFALVEIVNIYDEGIYFEPIYRYVTGVDPNKFISGLKCIDGCFSIYCVGNYNVNKDISLPETIRNVDEYIKNFDGATVDYIHGDDNLKKLVDSNKNSVGITFEKLDKSMLFKYVAKTGSLPRKTFSMGEGVEKRYYLEAKMITLEK